MAYGAYDAHVEHQGKRVRAAFAGEKAKDDPFAKVRIAEAASDIDAGVAPADRQRRRRVRAAARRARRFRSSCAPGPAATRCAPPAAPSRPIDLLFEASGATALNNDAARATVLA